MAARNECFNKLKMLLTATNYKMICYMITWTNEQKYNPDNVVGGGHHIRFSVTRF